MRCPNCGAPVGDEPVCVRCGEPLPRQAKAGRVEGARARAARRGQRDDAPPPDRETRRTIVTPRDKRAPDPRANGRDSARDGDAEPRNQPPRGNAAGRSPAGRSPAGGKPRRGGTLGDFFAIRAFTGGPARSPARPAAQPQPRNEPAPPAQRPPQNRAGWRSADAAWGADEARRDTTRNWNQGWDAADAPEAANWADAPNGNDWGAPQQWQDLAQSPSAARQAPPGPARPILPQAGSQMRLNAGWEQDPSARQANAPAPSQDDGGWAAPPPPAQDAYYPANELDDSALDPNSSTGWSIVGGGGAPKGPISAPLSLARRHVPLPDLDEMMAMHVNQYRSGEGPAIPQRTAGNVIASMSHFSFNLVLLALIVAILAVPLYLGAMRLQALSPFAHTSPAQQTPQPTAPAPTGFRNFANDTYSLAYPDGWLQQAAASRSIGGVATTIVAFSQTTAAVAPTAQVFTSAAVPASDIDQHLDNVTSSVDPDATPQPVNLSHPTTVSGVTWTEHEYTEKQVHGTVSTLIHIRALAANLGAHTIVLVFSAPQTSYDAANHASFEPLLQTFRTR